MLKFGPSEWLEIPCKESSLVIPPGTEWRDFWLEGRLRVHFAETTHEHQTLGFLRQQLKYVQLLLLAVQRSQKGVGKPVCPDPASPPTWLPCDAPSLRSDFLCRACHQLEAIRSSPVPARLGRHFRSRSSSGHTRPCGHQH